MLNDTVCQQARLARDARFDGLDQSTDLTFRLFEITRGAVAVTVLFGSLPVNFAAEFVDEGGDEVWVHQLVLKPGQDRGLELVSSYRD